MVSVKTSPDVYQRTQHYLIHKLTSCGQILDVLHWAKQPPNKAPTERTLEDPWLQVSMPLSREQPVAPAQVSLRCITGCSGAACVCTLHKGTTLYDDERTTTRALLEASPLQCRRRITIAFAQAYHCTHTVLDMLLTIRQFTVYSTQEACQHHPCDAQLPDRAYLQLML